MKEEKTQPEDKDQDIHLTMQTKADIIQRKQRNFSQRIADSPEGVDPDDDIPRQAFHNFRAKHRGGI